MNLLTPSGEIVATADNAYFLSYENDLLDGLFVDLDKQYLFLSKHVPEFPGIEAVARAEGIGDVKYSGDIRLDESPHHHVVRTLGNYVLFTAERSLGA